MIVLKRDDGELTTVTMDEFTELRRAELASPRSTCFQRNQVQGMLALALFRASACAAYNAAMANRPPPTLHTHHERSFQTNRFVYPVLSRALGRHFDRA